MEGNNLCVEDLGDEVAEERAMKAEDTFSDDFEVDGGREEAQWDPREAERAVSECERARGSFLGLAWGDIYGCPVEGWRPNSLAKVYGDYQELPQEYPIHAILAVGKSYARKLRPIGLYSDDTQQCMTLINVCIVRESESRDEAAEQLESEGDPEKQESVKPLPKGIGRVHTGPGPQVEVKWNLKKWGKTLATMFRTDALRGFGRNFKEAVAKLNHNIRPYQSGSNSEGMGAAMRIGPLGALFRYDSDNLAACAWESSFTTHATLPAAALSYAVAFAVGCLVRGESAEMVREKLPNAVAVHEKKWLLEPGEWEIWKSTENCHLISSTLRTVFNDFDLNDRTVIRKFLSDNAKPHLREGFVKAHPNQGHVLLGGLHGVIMALLPDIHPQEILREICVLGFDTDTVGAICGSLLGARFGVGWIPLHRMLERERLLAYAESIYLAGRSDDKRIAQEQESLEELIEKEIRLTAWTREVKRKNGMRKGPAGNQPQRGVRAQKQKDSGDEGEVGSHKERRQKGKKKGRRGGKGKYRDIY